ncbi:MAG: preprotein translocase subunit SecG [Syntrophobacteraceae bacterium]
MGTLIILFHLMACIALIAIVLLQTGKGAEMGAAFGGASQTLFGGSGGSSFMSKLTTAAAVVFMITCLLLSFMYRPGVHGGRSVMTDMPVEQPQAPPAPVQPQPVIPEARPVQPETSQQAPDQAKPQPETKAKPPAQQGQKTQEKAPAKKQ